MASKPILRPIDVLRIQREPSSVSSHPPPQPLFPHASPEAMTLVIQSNRRCCASAAAKYLERGDADGHPRDARQKSCDDIAGVMYAEV